MGCGKTKPAFSEPPARVIKTRSERFAVSQDVVVSIYDKGYVGAWSLSSSEELWKFNPPVAAQSIISPQGYGSIPGPGSKRYGVFLSTIVCDGDFVVGNFWENTLIHVWNLAEKKYICTFEVDEQLQNGPNLIDVAGDYIVAIGDSEAKRFVGESETNENNMPPAKVVVFSISQQKHLHQFDHICDCSMACCAISNKYVVVADDAGQVMVLDITNDFSPSNFKINHDGRNGNTEGIGPDLVRIVDDILLTVDMSGLVWDFTNDKEICLNDNEICSNNDKKLCVNDTASEDGGFTVMVWDLAKSIHMHTLNHEDIITDVAARGNRAVVCCTVEIILWDLILGTKLRTIDIHRAKYRCVGISGDLTMFCGSAYGGPISIWNA